MNSAIRLVEREVWCARLFIVSRGESSFFQLRIIYLILFCVRPLEESFLWWTHQVTRKKREPEKMAQKMWSQCKWGVNREGKGWRIIGNVEEAGASQVKVKVGKFSLFLLIQGGFALSLSCSSAERKRFVINHYLLKLFTQAQFP